MLERGSEGEYRSTITKSAWLGWKASREALPVGANDDGKIFSAGTVRSLWELKEIYRKEIGTLRKDAERDRWLRDKSEDQLNYPVAFAKERIEAIQFAEGGEDERTRYIGTLTGEHLDIYLDAAMRKVGATPSD